MSGYDGNFIRRGPSGSFLREELREPEAFTEDSADIRDHYMLLAGSTTQGGLGRSDERAFDECVDEFGYVPCVLALRGVSAMAKRRDDAYRARMAGVRR